MKLTKPGSRQIGVGASQELIPSVRWTRTSMGKGMSESFEEYRARVLSYLGDRNPMRVLSNTPARLRRLTSDVSPRVLAKRPAVGKWSIVEIVAHLADAELAIG
jgi:DinB superfamily